jgi:hypothetical protein
MKKKNKQIILFKNENDLLHYKKGSKMKLNKFSFHKKEIIL